MFWLSLRSAQKCRVFCATTFKIDKLKFNYVRFNSNILRSEYPNICIPSVTLPEYILDKFSKFPHKTAVECAETGRKYTYEEVRRKSININKGLRKKLKLRKGDVVAILLPNVPEYAICLLGILQAELRVTTVNPSGTVEEIRRQLLDANAKAIFTTCALGNVAANVVKLLALPIPIISTKTQISDVTPQGFINFEELTEVQFDIKDEDSSGTHDIAVIPYSSGTTGLQKGVIHSHNTLIANACQMNSPDVNYVETTTENNQETVPAILPFFHIYGLTVLLINQLCNLAKIVSIPKFTPELFLDTLVNHKPRILCMVPPIALFLINHSSVKKEHFESLRYIMSGAAPLGASDEHRLMEKSGMKLLVRQGYGLTEAPVATMTTASGIAPPGSVGRPIQNTQVKIVPTGNPIEQPLGCNEPGELLIKGPQVMLGYYKKPKETADTFADGWLKTGDLGYFDKDKNLFIQDRLKELIKVKGYQVPPAELEEIIRTYPNVTDAVVIGIPHEQYGEVPRAYITLKPDSKINLKHLDEFVDEKVSKYKQVKGGFVVVEKIPKTASGKYLRKDLKSQYLQENK